MSQPSIKKNYIYNTLYEILAIIAPLITAPYVSRVFGADGVGIYSYTSAITAYFTMFSAMGIKSYGQREIAQHRENPQECSKLFWELELMCISTTAVSLIVWTFLIIFSANYSVYYLVLTMTVLATAFDISWFWSGQEQYRFIVIRNSIIKILGIVLLFAFVRKRSDLVLYIALIAATGLLGNISMWSYLPKFLVKVDWKLLSVKHHYRQTFVYFIPTIATSIYTVLDKAMIVWITQNDFENGYYEQATKILNICKTLVFSINTVVSSRISFLFAKEAHVEIKQKLETTMNFILFLSIPITFGLIGVAKRFVPLFFGKGYDETIAILCFMSPLMIIIGISNCLGSLYFTPSGQRARSNKGIVTGAVVNLVLNLILIPFFASRGAVIASVVAESTITGIYLYMSRDYFDISCIFKFGWKRLIAAMVMFIVILFANNIISHQLIAFIVQVVLGIVTYVLCLLIMRDRFLLDNIKKYGEKLLHTKSKRM